MPSGSIGWILIVVLALVLAFTTVYTVGLEEQGVVLRFGKFVRTANPGLNLKLPFGLESVIKVPVQRQLKQEFGFRTQRSAVRSEFSSRGVEDEANILTGDLNAAVVEWVVQYRVVDPTKYLFRVRNVDETLRDMSEAVMREVVGDRTVNEVLTVGRQEIATLVEEKLQTLSEQYENGIRIDQVVLKDAQPPNEVKPSFNGVNEAEQERDKMRNQAQEAYNKVIPEERGKAEKLVKEAEAYSVQRVEIARGEASRFDSLYTQYRLAPEVTRKRIYLETMTQVLPKAGSKVVVDEDLRGILPLLNVGGSSSGTPAGGRQEPGS
jgi:membrane protease subunit HflK